MIGWAALGLALGGLAMTEIRAARRERAALAAFPPDGRILEVGGRRVHAVTRGVGPDVVLLHGASGNTRDMTFGLVGQLAGRYRVTAFDRPGLGHTGRVRDGLDGPFRKDCESPAEQAALLRDAARLLGIERPIVLGHSLGGAVALAWALDDPRGTAAVVDVSGVTMPWPEPLDLLYRLNGRLVGGAALPPLMAAYAGDGLLRRALAAIFEPDPVPPGYAEHIGLPLVLRRASLRANARQIGTLRRHVAEMSRRHGELRLPLEIVHGEADIIVPPGIHSLPLSRIVPDANLVMLPGTGHMAHHAHPEAVVAAVDRAHVRATSGG
ncbi:alpha/beta fold hydrolase [Rubellimicrobium aerolatum]|uniref:Alpha/beta fold hydrolase n=1 Tax=Rubellimicrobium aerolatum TaxID=490979 RepID=A0ABW0S865_9RHOB|nr:alpha/beta hydrolase [Rubellimicrobium aerolatum]MBP1804338.1 pimeloyl-ACP methyl ester carboxylesterase [Rubellimicrobium aerolatum]